MLWGTAKESPCDDNLPQLSVASENMIKNKAEWNAFVKANSFFILGAVESKCTKCCKTEPILNNLKDMLTSKMFTYPEKN